MTKSQRIGIFALFICAVGGLLYSAYNFKKAFPEVEVPLTYDKKTASAMMDSMISGMGANIAEYRNVVIMDEREKDYIDKEFGADTIPQIHLIEKIPVWMWLKRYFIPLQKEEYRIGIRPDDGKLVIFSHSIPESLTGADLATDTAQVVAEAFLSQQGYDLTEWELKTSKSEKRPHRTDHWFTYEKKNWELGDAKHWISVSVFGDEIGGFTDFLHVPEEWWREYDKTRSENEMFQNIDQFLAFIFVLLMLGYLLIAFRRGGMAWKFGAAFAVLVFFAGTAMTINSLPLTTFWYDTADSFGGFIIQHILLAVLNGAMLGLIAFVAGVTGERIYREFLPKSEYVPQICSPAGWGTSQFRTAVLAGYLFAFIHIGFVIFYYVFGKNFGFWSPTQSNYSDIMSTYLPWLFPISIGIMASVTEDFAFRLFGVSYLSKLFKSTLIGLIIPAIIWGFLHSNYPQEPGYVRGIEIGIIGIGAGLLMIRYGIVACLTWHYVVDAGLISFYVSQNADVLTIILCILGTLLPAILIVVGLVIKKKEKVALNEEMLPIVSETLKTQKIETPEPIPTYVSVKAGKKIVFLAIAVVCIVVALLAPKYPYQEIFLSRAEAIEKSTQFLTHYGVEIDSFETTTFINRGPTGMELRYVYKYLGWQGVNDVWKDKNWENLALWKTRYFVPIKENEYEIYIRPDGEMFAFTHSIEEGDSGATISQDSAFILASAMLVDFDKSEVLNWELIEKTTMERPHRTDHYFKWQSLDSISQAHFRIAVSVLGDEPSLSLWELKRPEEWDRQDSKKTPVTIAMNILPYTIWAILILIVLLRFGASVIKKTFGLKVFLYVALIAFIAHLINSLNTLPTFLSTYYTAMPIERFYVIGGIGYIISIIFGAIAAAIAVGAFWGTEFKQRLFEKIPARENLLLSAIAVFILAGVMALIRWLEISLNLPLRDVPIMIGKNFDSYLPVLALPLDLVRKALVLLPALFVGYFALRKKYFASAKLFAVAVLIVIVISLGGQKAIGEVFWNIAKNMILLVACWLIIKSFLRDSVPIYISAIILGVSLKSAMEMMQCAGNSFYLWNAIITALLGILLWIFSAIYFHGKEAKKGEFVSFPH